MKKISLSILAIFYTNIQAIHPYYKKISEARSKQEAYDVYKEEFKKHEISAHSKPYLAWLTRFYLKRRQEIEDKNNDASIPVLARGLRNMFAIPEPKAVVVRSAVEKKKQ